jgi:hypothetical protein
MKWNNPTILTKIMKRKEKRKEKRLLYSEQAFSITQSEYTEPIRTE